MMCHDTIKFQSYETSNTKQSASIALSNESRYRTVCTCKLITPPGMDRTAAIHTLPHKPGSVCMAAVQSIPDGVKSLQVQTVLSLDSLLRAMEALCFIFDVSCSETLKLYGIMTHYSLCSRNMPGKY